MRKATRTQLILVRTQLKKATFEAEHLRQLLAKDIYDGPTSAEYDDLCELAAALEDLQIRFTHLWPATKGDAK